MAHIDLGFDEHQFPGMAGLMRYRPETGKAISELADFLLRAPNSMPRGDRELIAAYVSRLNECKFCASSHSAVAAAQLDKGMPLVEQVLRDPETAEVSPRTRAGSIAAWSAGSTRRAVSAKPARTAYAARCTGPARPVVGVPIAVITATVRS